MTPAVLYRDARFLVLDKPAGLAVHPGRAGGPSVEDFFPGWRAGRQGPWLAHRLDRDTAGCLVVALKKSALLAAQELFAGGGVEKVYWAVVQGRPKAARGMIDLPLGKVTAGRHWKMAVDRAAAPAVTAWEVLGTGDGVAWVEFRPRTGRTHQIRAHAQWLGMPIAGDEVYGEGGGPLCLLARSVRLPLEPEVAATAPVPDHMAGKLLECGYGAE